MDEPLDQSNEFERQLKQYAAEVGAEVKALPQRQRTDMARLRAEVREQFGGAGARRVSWRQRLRGGERRRGWWLPLGLAGGLAALLLAGWFVLLRPQATPIRFEFASVERGTRSPTVTQPLDDKLVMELDLARNEIRFLEGTLSYTGRIAAQRREIPEITPYNFEARGTNPAGEIVVARGKLKLTQKAAQKSPRTREDFLRAHVAGTVEIGRRLTNYLDRFSADR